MWDLFSLVHTSDPEAIRNAQRLAQAVCLQFSTKNCLWNVLALWNSLLWTTM